MLFPFKTPNILKNSFPSMEWEKKDGNIRLTFDDGPHPTITPWVVDILNKYNIKATFFCVGDNAVKHPEIIELLKANGHQIANHTHNHVNGWKTDTKEYLDNVSLANKTLQSNLFRPPYGKIKKAQRKEIEKNYRIIQWSLLSGDFDPNLKKEKALRVLCNQTNGGDIVVFHDSEKAKENLEFLLPKYLEYCIQNKLKFALL